MTKQVQHRRGDSADHAIFTGAQGEITVNTDTYRIAVHDGVTEGGHSVALMSDIVSTVTDISDLTDTNGLLTPTDLSGYATETFVTNAISASGGTGGTTYTLPTATTTVKGGVKVDGITIISTLDGTISAVGGGSSGSTSITGFAVYNNVSALNVSSLDHGTLVVTKCYRALGDDGHANYIVMSPSAYGKTADNFGDHTLANGNIAVLLYSGRANIMQFGAFNDGVTSNHEVFKVAGARGIPLVFPPKGNFVINDQNSTIETQIRFTNSVDFNNSKISITGGMQRLYMGSDDSKQWTSYAANSPEVQALVDHFNATGEKLHGKYIAAWDNVYTDENGDQMLYDPNVEIAEKFPDLSECFLKIETDQKWYNYRTTSSTDPRDPTTRTEFNFTTSKGQLLSQLKYDLDPTRITAIKALKLSNEKTIYENLVYEHGPEWEYSRGITCNNSTNVDFINFSIDMIPGQIYETPNGFSYLTAEDSAFIRVFDYKVVSPIQRYEPVTAYGRIWSFSYCLAFNNVYDAHIEGMIAQGDGYGAIGNNSAARVTYKKCDLNRIDFHNPCYDYLKVQDCTIGNWGIKVSMVGDLTVSDTTFNLYGGNWVPGGSVITSRQDIGGWADGHLLLENCTINMNWRPGYENASAKLVTATTGAETSQPTESQLNFWNWETQTFRDLKISQGIIYGGGFSGGHTYIKESRSVTFDGIRVSNGGRFIIHSHNNASDLPQTMVRDITVDTNGEAIEPRWWNTRPNREVTIRDCDVELISFSYSGGKVMHDVTIDGVTNSTDTLPRVEISEPGTYRITNSKLASISGANSTVPMPNRVIVENNTLAGTAYLVGADIYNKDSVLARGDEWSFINNQLNGWSIGANSHATYYNMLKGYCAGNTVSIDGSEPFNTARYGWPPSSTAPVGYDFRNTVLVTSSASSGNEAPWDQEDYKSAEMRLPRLSGHTAYAPITDADGVTLTTTRDMTTGTIAISAVTGGLPINAVRFKL